MTIEFIDDDVTNRKRKYPTVATGQEVGRRKGVVEVVVIWT